MKYLTTLFFAFLFLTACNNDAPVNTEKLPQPVPATAANPKAQMSAKVDLKPLVTFNSSEDFGKFDIDEAYLANISEEEKSIIALYTLMGSTGCEWQGGQADAQQSNLQCQLNTALGLGAQCSDQQRSLIQKYFSKNKKVMGLLDNCYRKGDDSTGEKSYFEKLSINNVGGLIQVGYQFTKLDPKTGGKSVRNGNDRFQITKDGIRAVVFHH